MRIRTVRRCVQAAGALAALALFVPNAPAEHRVLDQVSLGPAGGNSEQHAAWLDASADGKRVFLSTAEALTTGDDDALADVYERSGGQTTLRTPGTGGEGVSFVDASDDGRAVAVVTTEALSDDDTDTAADFYAFTAGAPPELLSGGPTSAGSWDPSAGALSADGSGFAFATADSLTADDDDAHLTDVYLHRGGVTYLASGGPADDDTGAAELGAITADGRQVLFDSTTPLIAGETDGTDSDVYRYVANAAAPVLLTPGTVDPATFAGASPDGAVVVISALERLSDDDLDDSEDLYAVRAGGDELISIGPDGGNSNAFTPPGLDAVSADGTHIVFHTGEPLFAADADGTAPDLYVRAGGTTSWVSTSPVDFHFGTSGQFKWISPDGARIVFSFNGSLSDADTDGSPDLYEYADGTTSLLSTGTTDDGSGFVTFAGASEDADRVLFRTPDRIEPGDADDSLDLYERHAGTTTRISAGPGTGNAAQDVVFGGLSADGARAWFETAERMLPASDTDSAVDVYEQAILAPANTVAPAISGTPVEGSAVLCTNGTWDNEPTAFAHQWNRDGGAIGGATSQPHVITAADVGHLLTCTVTASNAGGATSATSAPVTPTAAQNPPPPPPPGGGLLPGACANVKRGTSKQDRLTGTAAGDRLVGRGGNDTLSGGKGDDCLSGGNGKDSLRGGAGQDKLTGGKGVDRLEGGGGNDSINSRDHRRETVRCGKGKGDRVTADRQDKLRGCERVKRR